MLFLFISFFSTQMVGQLSINQEMIRDHFRALIQIGEALPDDLEVSGIPEDPELLNTFLESLDIDATSFVHHFSLLSESIFNYAEDESIDLNTDVAHTLVFEGLLPEIYVYNVDESSEIADPTYCYDKFINDLTQILTQSIASAASHVNVDTEASEFIIHFIKTSQAFDKCIKDEY